VNPRDLPAAEPTQAPAPPAVPPALWLLIAMVGIGPFALLPLFAANFAAPPGQAQLLLTLALAGVAVGQLVYGPLSDRFGRRPVILGGLAVFTLASLGAALAQSLHLLVALRMAQTLGACAGMVVGRAIVRDCFGRDKAASVMGYVMMGMTVAPMLAPFVASQLAALANWHAVFALCAAMGVALLAAVALRLHETLAAPQPMPGAAGLARMYGALLSVPAFRAHAATVALSSGVFFSFIGGAPHIVVTGLGLSPSAYGYAFLATSGFFGFGNFIAGRYAQSIGAPRMIAIGTALSFVGTALALAAMALLPPSILNLFVPSVLMAVGNGISQTNAIMSAVSVRPLLAGTASGLAGFCQMACGAVLSWVTGAVEDGRGIATGAIMLACAAATQALLAWMRVRRIG
jgi:DHA1 family bicyclomycin/chloramphenicol resistance-like MFS transporter